MKGMVHDPKLIMTYDPHLGWMLADNWIELLLPPPALWFWEDGHDSLIDSAAVRGRGRK